MTGWPDGEVPDPIAEILEEVEGPRDESEDDAGTD